VFQDDRSLAILERVCLRQPSFDAIAVGDGTSLDSEVGEVFRG
jgi:hypothetical protein